MARKPQMNLARIAAAMAPLGLHPLGCCPTEPADGLPTLPGERPAAGIVLVGNIGSSLWPVFSVSPEFSDGRPDPLDRWSRRVGAALAEHLGAGVVYPFDGPPYWPFQSWAGRCGETAVSPLAVLIHARFGLWHAYRFALVFAELPATGTVRLDVGSPCLGCTAKPCLDACPVGAFGDRGYDLEACVAHLHGAQAVCPDQGCLARRACPVGTRYTYVAEQRRFHMDAFMAMRPRR